MSQCEVFQPGFKIMTWFTLFWTSQGLLIRKRLCFDLIFSHVSWCWLLYFPMADMMSLHPWYVVTPVPSSAAHNNGPNHSSPVGGVILTDWLISQHWAMLPILLDVRYGSDQSETSEDCIEIELSCKKRLCKNDVQAGSYHKQAALVYLFTNKHQRWMLLNNSTL